MQGKATAGDSVMAVLSVLGIGGVYVANNAELLRSWLQTAQSVTQSVEAPNTLIQAIVGFAVVSIIRLIMKRPTVVQGAAQSDDAQPTGVGYRQSKRQRTASDFRRLREV